MMRKTFRRIDIVGLHTSLKQIHVIDQSFFLVNEIFGTTIEGETIEQYYNIKHRNDISDLQKKFLLYSFIINNDDDNGICQFFKKLENRNIKPEKYEKYT